MGKVIWFTGLSGSGKTTLSINLKKRLLKEANKSILILDGDAIREASDNKLRFSRNDIRRNNLSIAKLAKEKCKLYFKIFD